MDILQQLQAAKTDEERSWILMQFSLDGLTPELREAVWAAAIPHWFDKAFLDALLQKFLSNQDFETLKDLSYVEKFERGLISEGYKLENGWNVHERTRNLLLEKLWQDQPERYRELNRRAAEYCAKQDQKNTIWRIEYLHHALLAENDGAWIEFANQGIEWNNSPNFAYDKIEALVRPVLDEIKAGKIKGTAAAWAYDLQGCLDIIYDRYFEAKKNLQLALQQETDNKGLKAECIKDLGDVHRMLSEYDAARGRYEEALPIYRQIGDRLGEANCMKALGDVHRMLDEYDSARVRYEEALPIFRQIGSRLGEANCMKALGDVHRMLSEYDAARVRYEEALQIFRQIGDRLGETNCVWRIGVIYQMLEEYELAQNQYKLAYHICKSIDDHLGEAYCIKSFGDIHLKLSEYGQAQDCFTQAFEMFEKLGVQLEQADCFKAWGELHVKLSQHADATEKYRKALEIYEKIGTPKGRAECVDALESLAKLNQD
jgi:tetratricopeptide (TPR) repeat protein